LRLAVSPDPKFPPLSVSRELEFTFLGGEIPFSFE